MSEPVHLTLSGGVALLTIDNPPVNVISQAARAGLMAALDAAEAAALRSLGIDVGRPFTVVVVTDRRDPRALSPAMVAALCDPANGPAVAVYGPAEVGLPPVESVPCLRHGLAAMHRLPRQ